MLSLCLSMPQFRQHSSLTCATKMLVTLNLQLPYTPPDGGMSLYRRIVPKHWALQLEWMYYCLPVVLLWAIHNAVSLIMNSYSSSCSGRVVQGSDTQSVFYIYVMHLLSSFPVSQPRTHQQLPCVTVFYVSLHGGPGLVMYCMLPFFLLFVTFFFFLDILNGDESFMCLLLSVCPWPFIDNVTCWLSFAPCANHFTSVSKIHVPLQITNCFWNVFCFSL